MSNQKVEFIKGIEEGVLIYPHGNKETCNKNMYEINPSIGCQFRCQYCNAYTQEEENEFKSVKVFLDYPQYLKGFLEEHKEELDKIFFYFSPKVDAFQKCLLESGVTEQILLLFKEYNVRYLIVTKSGIPNENICKILNDTKEKNQILISCSMPNEEVRKIMEPDAAEIAKRLEFAKYCIEKSINVTAIFSPIFPVDNYDYIKKYIQFYLEIGITHFRLNFTEVSLYSLNKIIALLPQYKEDFLKVYLSDDTKNTNWNVPYKNIQLQRRFPSLKYMQEVFYSLKEYAKNIDERATFSICNSLCKENELCNFNSEAFEAGFGCIGYKW